MNTVSRSHLFRALLALWTSALIAPCATAGTVVELDIDGGIGAATAEYVIAGIDHAESVDAELVIIRMDTPGGLMNSMRDIITRMLNAEVAVATYVSPAGARADSAGTFILLGSHIAAMSPTTHVGAATPVSINGDDVAPEGERQPDEGTDADKEKEQDAGKSEEPTTAMGRKIMNDSVAYIRNLADRYGRNADWAELAVREAKTLSAEQALELNVIDLIAVNRSELLQKIDGREVMVNNVATTLSTSEVDVERYQPSWRIKILSVLQQPEVILLLGMIGVYGLLFEGYNPGAIVPGVAGAICLLLAAYALQILPINYAGIALIILGLGLMIAEAFAPSFGVLGIGGIAAFSFGAVMMFDSGIPGFGISVWFVVTLAIIAFALLFLMMTYLIKLRRRGAISGTDSIVGGIATAMEDFDGEGKVWLEGEAWAAVSAVPLEKDQQVIVSAINGLTLTVEPGRVNRPGN